MTFYDEWRAARKTENDKYYIREFLNESKESISVLEHGTIDELVVLTQLLTDLKVEECIDVIEGDYEYSSKDIVQYSNFIHAVRNTCNILSANMDEAMYVDLGKQLNKSKSIAAQRKYGENHAKLAELFSLVSINRNKGYVVKNTAFGSFSVSITDEQLFPVLRILGLRNKFVKEIISLGKLDVVHYPTLAKRALNSESTINRRRTNIKHLVEFCLGKDNRIYNNIIW